MIRNTVLRLLFCWYLKLSFVNFVNLHTFYYFEETLRIIYLSIIKKGRNAYIYYETKIVFCKGIEPPIYRGGIGLQIHWSVVKMGNFRDISNEISFLINSALGSAKIKSLVVEEDEKDYNMRSSLHVILRSPVGQAKSTIMEQIGKTVNREIFTEVSRAGLVGSLDNKTYQVIPGATWECRNSLLLMDEFAFGKKKEGWEVFLQLLESQRWSKRIGIFSADQNMEDEDLYFRVSKGKIDLKTRFSCIVATMKNFAFHRGQSFRAFVTRCIPYSFDLSIDDLNKISEGKELFKLKVTMPEEKVYLQKSKYRKIKRIVMKELNKCPDLRSRKELFLRSIGDCCRIYAVWGKNDRRFFNDIVAWKIGTHMLIGKYYTRKKNEE